MRTFVLLTLLSVPPISLASDNIADDLARMGFSSAGGAPKAAVKSESPEPIERSASIEAKTGESNATVTQSVPPSSSTMSQKETGSNSGLPKTAYRLGSNEGSTAPASAIETTTQPSASPSQPAPQPKGLEDELARMGFSKSN